MKHLFKQPFFYTTIFSLIALGLIIGNFVFGWTTPTAIPPSSNLPAPINVSSTEQTKAGNLIIGGVLRLGQFATAPSGTEGALYFNTTEKKTKVYSNAAWGDLGSTAPVSSVFGRTGAVTAASGDYSVGNITGAAPLASPTFTGTVTAPTFSGALNGNATTATNVAWTGVTSKPTLPSSQEGTRYTTNFNTILSTGFFNAEGTPTNSPGGSYGQLIAARGIDTGLQIYGGYNNDNLWFRGWWSSGAGFGTWRTVIHSGNIGSQSVNYATTAGNVPASPACVFCRSCGGGWPTTAGTWWAACCSGCSGPERSYGTTCSGSLASGCSMWMSLCCR